MALITWKFCLISVGTDFSCWKEYSHTLGNKLSDVGITLAFTPFPRKGTRSAATFVSCELPFGLNCGFGSCGGKQQGTCYLKWSQSYFFRIDLELELRDLVPVRGRNINLVFWENHLDSLHWYRFRQTSWEERRVTYKYLKTSERGGKKWIL